MSLRERFWLSPWYDFLGKRSYAQSGEDVVADAELGRKRKGVYVDVGAFHPKLFSNTYLFYKRGWRGVCVEPRPDAQAQFKKVRPGDRFVAMGVGKKKDVLEYWEFNDPAANTFSSRQAKKNTTEAGRKLVRKVNVAVMPLRDIMAQAGMDKEKIDLLSVDVEGMDLEVLESNDWEKYRPEIVICEDLDFEMENWSRSKVVSFLVGNDYRLVAKTPYSLIFRDKKGK